MKKFAKYIIVHPLFSGSAIMVLGSNFANFLAYIYHLVLGRMLGPAFYGELAAVISVLGILSTFFTFLSLVIVKFISGSPKKETGVLISWFSKKVFKIGLIIAFGILLLSSSMSNFLNINIKIIYLIGPIFFFFLLTFVNKAFLQGLLKFSHQVVVLNIELVVRLFLGVFLVYLSFSVFGAVLGILIGAIIGYILSLYFLREFRFFKGKVSIDKARDIFSYAFPVFAISAATHSFMSSDVILVKHFFDPHSAGLYSALSTLGKIIFYGAAPVSAVMFPMVSQRAAMKRGYKKIFFLSLLLTLAISSGVLLIYLFFPDISIRLLYGDKFLGASSNLVWFGLFIAIFTLCSLILSFFLSIGKTKIAILPIIFASLQIIGIWFFHQSIFSVIKVSVVSVSLLLISLIIYFGYETKRPVHKE